jgi:LAO/AO transport system kinase
VKTFKDLVSEYYKLAKDISTILKMEDQNQFSPPSGSLRLIGVTGNSGAGKSTLIGKIANELVSRNFKVAILLIDPTSVETGGTLLGDRIRLDPSLPSKGVYIRSLSTGRNQSNLPRNLGMILAVLEEYRFDFVLIETIGIGQAEAEIRSHVDTLIVLPAIDVGDSLQYYKTNVFELCDVIFVNKSDLQLETLNLYTKKYLEEFISIKAWINRQAPQVVFGSAKTGEGLEELIFMITQVGGES